MVCRGVLGRREDPADVDEPIDRRMLWSVPNRHAGGDAVTVSKHNVARVGSPSAAVLGHGHAGRQVCRLQKEPVVAITSRIGWPSRVRTPDGGSAKRVTGDDVD